MGRFYRWRNFNSFPWIIGNKKTIVIFLYSSYNNNNIHKKNDYQNINILQISYVMCQYRYFICPIEYSEALGRMTMDCEPSSLFQPQEYGLPKCLQVITRMVILS